VNPDGFLRDVLVAPDRLASLLDAYDGPGSPLSMLTVPMTSPRRVIFVGMGSSRFAAAAAAAHLRSQGVDAVVEYASTTIPVPPSPDSLAVGISASGTTPETVVALRAHRGTSMTVAVTNAPDSELASEADVVLPLLAGAEAGGVACLTYQATIAALLLLAGRMTADGPDVGKLRPAVAAGARLREERASWLDAVVEHVDAARTVATIAPPERLSSALQSALILREGPRAAAGAAETGDWLHVDVYLSKRPGYAAFLFAGSRFDADVLEWSAKRGFPVVSVGAAVPGSTIEIAHAGAGSPFIPLLVETGAVELVTAELWHRRVAAGDPALVDP
jgi:fructoselysine-6-P-deglycase FrlB-like protein